MTTVTRSIQFAVTGRRKRALVGQSPPTNGGKANVSVGRVPRVARLMALAIRFDQLLREGVVANQSELARLAHVTQPRMTQIMNLLHLAPDIQEEVLYLQPAIVGRGHLHERMLRPLTTITSWQEQRRRWSHIVIWLNTSISRRG